MPTRYLRRTIEENFRFLLVEVIKQMEASYAILQSEEDGDLQAVRARDDYIDNLKNTIVRQCFASAPPVDDQSDAHRALERLMTFNVAATNLERIADHAENISKQVRYLEPPEFIEQFPFPAFFNIIIEALHMLDDLIGKEDIRGSLKLCKVEYILDEKFSDVFESILTRLRTGQDTGNLLTVLFIFRYLERIGDCLLNIGEANISAVVGERLKISHYQALQESLSAAGEANIPIEDLEYRAYRGTRSGARVARVQPARGDALSNAAIFKEGKKQKILEEKQSLERWAELRPGLVPRVFDYSERDENASLLVEFLEGETLQSLLLNPSNGVVDRALDRVLDTLNQLWTDTLSPEPINAQFMRQLRKRLSDVHFMHPSLTIGSKSVGGVNVASHDDLVEKVARIEQDLNAPFSVLIHGDFNIDNILFSPETDAVYFIDLHRSKQFDYIQDISVCMVSSFRLPIDDSEIRDCIERMNGRLLDFAREFAAEHNDETMDLRLAIGLARSLMTSTRFVVDRDFAKLMYLRAIYLLEQVIAHAQHPSTAFSVNEEILHY